MIQVSDSEEELDKSLGVCPSRLVIAHVVSSSEEEEEEEMLLERKKGLRELIASKAKGSRPKDSSGSQLPPALPSPPPPSVNPFKPTNLKKRKKEKEVAKKGELVPDKEEAPPKLPKIAKGKGKGSSIESKEDKHVAEMGPQNLAWNHQL